MLLLNPSLFPTSWSSIRIRNKYVKNKKILSEEVYAIFPGKTVSLIWTCAHRPKCGLRAKYDLFFSKPGCAFCSSIHVLTCGSLFCTVGHSSLGALWKRAFQVHTLQIPEVSGNLPFAFSSYLKMECFGAAQYCCAIHYGTKECLGLGRQATNDPSFCLESIKIDT